MSTPTENNEDVTVIPPARPSHSDESIKETFESIVIAFILAFVFRSYVVEAFVIPTGSMAPTLLGEHLHAQCKSCGYIFDFDPPDVSRYAQVGGDAVRTGAITAPNAGYREELIVSCPMCHFPYAVEQGRKVVAGDRILVQKYLYSVPGMGPRRWDVVVFKAPHKPEDNYIKRLVGLPNEAIQVIEGNVYVAPLKKDGTIDNAAWRIARKVDTDDNPHADTIQRAVWQPVYHSQFIPTDIIESENGHGDTARSEPQYQWQLPWVAKEGVWTGLSGDTASARRSISRNYTFDGAGRGRIEFQFDRATAGGQWLYIYNSVKDLHPNQGRTAINSNFRNQPKIERRVEDLRIAATVSPAGDGGSIAISTQARVPDASGEFALTELRGEIDSSGEIRLIAVRGNGEEELASAQSDGAVLRSGSAREVELWFVDQELGLWVDGRRRVTHRFEPSIDAAMRAKPLGKKPEVAIEVSGTALTLRNVEVDRDIYYTVPGMDSRGVVVKNGRSPATPNPFAIYDNQFFCMGDNSPNSTDSRSWGSTVEWIRQRKFENPYDLRQDGVVPRRLMMGRAFFVYFPGPHGKSETGRHLIPNFGEMRFIR